MRASWNTKIQHRMENFNFANLNCLLRKTTIFNFLYEEGKTKNAKATHVLVDKSNNLYIHLFMGFDSNGNFYFPNSFVVDYQRDSNLSRKGTKIIKTEIYKIDIAGKEKIETVEHEQIRLISDGLKQNIKVYSSKNEQIYILANKNEEYKDVLDQVNILSKTIKKDYERLVPLILAEEFFASKSNDKIKNFLVIAKII